MFRRSVPGPFSKLRTALENSGIDEIIISCYLNAIDLNVTDLVLGYFNLRIGLL